MRTVTVLVLYILVGSLLGSQVLATGDALAGHMTGAFIGAFVNTLFAPAILWFGGLVKGDGGHRGEVR